MTRFWLTRQKHGFVLIEVMLVVILIAILSIIVIPRLLGTGRRAREASLKGDLKQIREAIERFEGDCYAYPPRLEDLMAQSGDDISADVDGRGLAVDRRAFKGPYLVTSGGLPKDPFTGETDWSYDNTTGEVHSSSTAVGINHTPYAQW